MSWKDDFEAAARRSWAAKVKRLKTKPCVVGPEPAPLTLTDEEWKELADLADEHTVNKIIERATERNERPLPLKLTDGETDDPERASCEKAGTLGHYFCGVCEKHNVPRFECGCYKIEEQ